MTINKRSTPATRQLIAAVLLLGLPAPALSEANPFVEAMRAMLYAFGMANNNSVPWQTLPAQGAMLYPNAYNLSSMPLAGSWNPAQHAGTFNPMTQSLNPAFPNAGSSANPLYSNTTPLEGNWVGLGDLVLRISGEQFVLTKGGSYESVSGRIQTQDNYVAMQLQTGTRPYYFEYAIHEGRLALRAENGSLLLFRQAGSSTTYPGQQMFQFGR